MQTDVREHRRAAALRALAVGEGHVLKVDGAVRDLLHGVRRGDDVRLLAEHLLDALRRGDGLAEHDEDHGDHHQAHEDVHDIGKQAGELAGGQARAAHDHLRAEPADEQDARIHAAHHDRHVQGDDLLRGDGVFVQVLRRALELAVLVILAYKGLHHADGADVLLDRAVDHIILAEHLLEVAHGHGNQDEQRHAQHQHHAQEDHGEPGVDGQRHHQRDDERHRRARAHHQDHLEGVLHVGHVRGQARDQAGGGEFVDVGKGKALDVFKHRLAQVAGEARARPRAELVGLHAKAHGQQRHGGHQQADFYDVRHVARGDAVVDDRRGHVRDQNLQDHAADGAQRGEQRVAPVLPDVPGQAFSCGQFIIHVGKFLLVLHPARRPG